MKRETVQLGDVRCGDVYERVGKNTMCRVVAVLDRPYPCVEVETVHGPNIGRRTRRRDMRGLRLVPLPDDGVQSEPPNVLPFDMPAEDARTLARDLRELTAAVRDLIRAMRPAWNALPRAR